jgi:hypothetical protein
MPLDNQYENQLPEAIRRQVAAADEIARAAGVTGVPDPVVVDPPVEPPAADPAPVEPPAADPAPITVSPPAEDWEQRYRTLQGKYDAEVPHMRGQLMSLQQLVANMQHAPAPPVPATPTTTVPIAASISPEDIETYGEDLVVAARRWAADEVRPQIDALYRDLAELRGGHNTIRAETTQDRVHLALDSDPVLTGRWRDVNNDPMFIAWLNEHDPFSGHQRIVMLREAYGSGDSARTARFFKTYLAEHTAVSSVPAAAAAQTPQTGVAGARPTLEDLAAPGRTNTAPAPGGAPTEKRAWTKAQISAFYRDRMQGKYASREAEATRIELDIFAAAPEGRIRN